MNMIAASVTEFQAAVIQVEAVAVLVSSFRARIVFHARERIKDPMALNHHH